MTLSETQAHGSLLLSLQGVEGGGPSFAYMTAGAHP